ncbi:hypothetical protein HYV69_03615 [Candidatus Uhrbacteria bacterium]|nr:hypothetical protein [Candidatus Uhrbacteria bacterium]
MSSTSSEQWNEGLRLISFCPVCETRYKPSETKTLNEDDQTRLLHVQCSKCKHSVLALVLINKVGASSIGLLTDLVFDDVLKFRANRRVTVNDVIEIHTSLEAGISGLDLFCKARHNARA